jgi:hypothetical protein
MRHKKQQIKRKAEVIKSRISRLTKAISDKEQEIQKLAQSCGRLGHPGRKIIRKEKSIYGDRFYVSCSTCGDLLGIRQ